MCKQSCWGCVLSCLIPSGAPPPPPLWLLPSCAALTSPWGSITCTSVGTAACPVPTSPVPPSTSAFLLPSSSPQAPLPPQLTPCRPRPLWLRGLHLCLLAPARVVALQPCPAAPLVAIKLGQHVETAALSGEGGDNNSSVSHSRVWGGADGR